MTDVPDFPPEQPTGPDPVAEADQIIGGLAQFARIQWGYYWALRGEGFGKRAALDLLQQWTDARIGAEDDEPEL